MDMTDKEILRRLGADARVPVAQLARTVGLSAPSVAERIRRLEETGVIRGYHVDIDPRAIGRGLAAYIRVRPIPGRLNKVIELIQGLESIVECVRVTGDDCFIAEVHVASVEELEAAIDRFMPYASTNTSIVQSSPVARRLPPLSARN